MAWIGRQGDVWDALEAEGAEKDEQGRFLVAVPGVTSGKVRLAYSSFMASSSSDQDVVIGDSLRYRKQDEWKTVVDLLRGRGLHEVKVY